MEDIVGWSIIAALGLLVGLAVYLLFVRRSIDEVAEQQKAKINDLKTKIRPTPPPPPSRATSGTTPRATSGTSVKPAEDWSPDILTTMIIADMLTHNKDTSAGTVTWEGNKPTIHPVSNDSFGFDDSDSRKSVSSTFSSDSSSFSSSSFSSDSSSSSSSGPSSDW